MDAALWYVQAAHDFLAQAQTTPGFSLPQETVETPWARLPVRALKAYGAGTRLGISADADGLLRCGEGGTEPDLDGRTGERSGDHAAGGQAVEIQAFWINALILCTPDEHAFGPLAARALASFTERFWNQQRRCLFDVVDVDHRPGTTDDRLHRTSSWRLAA